MSPATQERKNKTAKMKLTAQDIYKKKAKKEKVTVLTAYDALFARILDEEAVDVILVGDSLGNVLLGYEDTLPVTMEDMLHHTKAAARSVKHGLVVADMPNKSYETPEAAVKNARRFLDEARADAVKVEGGRKIEAQVKALIAAGIPVMGHTGMTPQTAAQTGGYTVRGKDKKGAEQIIADAQLLDRLGVFAIVLECVPAKLGAEISARVKCPVIGIGAGAGADGQVLVIHDLLGFSGKIKPRFVRRYADFENEMRRAVRAYCKDVTGGKFPSQDESY